MRETRSRQGLFFVSVLVASLGLSSAAFADDHVRGVITSRPDTTSLVMQTDENLSLAVVLADSTKVRRMDGFRVAKASSATLMPGLRVQLSGRYDGTYRFYAEHVTFTRADQKMALSVAAGVGPTDQRSLANAQAIQQQGQVLQQHAQQLGQQQAAIAANQQQIAANELKIVATTGELNTRLANLDDYNAISSIVIYFRNGSASVSKQYKGAIEHMAAQAKSTPGYAIQVQGYASAVGADALNQQLSMKRADIVTAFLQQNGIPPTNFVVPAAMGTTGQVASNKTAKGQAENRRAVVTLLQNKGIAAH